MEETTYALVMVIDEEELASQLSDITVQEAFHDLVWFIEARGFKRITKDLYMGKHPMDAVSAILYFQDLIVKFPWVSQKTMPTARLLRIGENTSLAPVLTSAEPAPILGAARA